MELYILNKSLEEIGVIDVFASIIWTKRYFSAGDFELYLPATEENINLLQSGNYIQRMDDDTIMIIEKIIIETDAEKGNYLTVSGRSLESILSRRIIWQQHIYLHETFENIIIDLLNKNVISPTNTSRKINNFLISTNGEFNNTLSMQVSNENLYEKICEMCTAYKIGWKITLNENNQFVFSLYQGVDRSYNQSENPHVVFSPEFDNLINSNYERDTSKFANVALVGGEGEGNLRKFQTVSIAGGGSDLDRYEIFVDAKSMSTNAEEEITDAEYNTMLSEQGIEKLNENTVTTAFEGELETTSIYIYKQDWFIGDTIQIENEYGLTATSQILEIIESEDVSGHKTIPTFAEWEV